MAYNTFSPIITNGLVFCLDAANNKSYPGIGLNWYDLKTVTPSLLTNGAYYAPWNDGAISFDGLSDYVKLNDINIGTVGSWSIWVNANSFGGVIVGSNIVNYYMVYYASGSFYINYGGTLGTISYPGLSTGIWHNIACVRNGYSHEIFLNGSSIGTMTISTTNDSIFSIIGDERTSSPYPFNGKVSSFLIYDRALSSDEISYNYDAIKFRYLNNNTFPSITTSDLILNLDAGDLTSYSGSGPTWYDLTANSYDGTLTNGASFSSIGADNMGFDGTNDFVELGDVLDMGTYSYTINTWVKISATSSDQKFFSKSLSGTQNYRYAVGFLASTQKLWAFMQGNGGSDIKPYGSTTILPYQWFMATYVYDRGSNIKIYYNGVLETLTTSSTISSWNGLDFQSNNPARVGAYTAADNTSPIETTNGKIAISQIYRRALPASEILYNYNITKWRFLNDNTPPLPPIITNQLVLNIDAGDPTSYPGSGTTWYDLTVNVNDGTLTNGVVYNSSPYGGVMVFDGVNDFVDVPNSSSLNPTQSITMCAWLEYNGSYTGYYAPFIFKQNTGGSYFEQYSFAFLNTGQLNVAIGNGSYNEYIISPLSYTSQLINAVGIIDVVNQVLELYVNGVFVQSSSISQSSFTTSTNSVRIGGNNVGFAGYMGGSIYNVLIYSKALTAAEVLQNYNAQKSKYGL